MRLKGYQFGELAGIFFLLASTATQIFYLEPLKREVEWRLATFSIQQTGQLEIKAIYGNRIATLQALKASPDEIKAAETERDTTIAQYKTADANIADYLFEKQRVEDYLQWIVIALFGLGTLLAGFGRAMEMVAGQRAPN
jgi:hypothetical protein